MANFATHIKVSIFSSAALSTIVLNTHIATPSQSLLLFVVGALCGLLPDLDADNSNSIDWLFSILGISLSSIAILLYLQSSIFILWLMAGATYLATHWIIKPLFEKITVHRGSLHSLLAVIMFTFIGTSLTLFISHSLNLAILVGVFIALGALTHLILDEVYSVDLENNTIKASFGTAIKLIDIRFPFTCLLQVVIIMLACLYLSSELAEAIRLMYIWQEKLVQLSFIPSFFSTEF